MRRVLDRETRKSLSDLARSNMFLVALDARREWYRYHHLFGEVLHSSLVARPRPTCAVGRQLGPQTGLVEDAIEYAAAAQTPEMVADLLERASRVHLGPDGSGSSLGGLTG